MPSEKQAFGFAESAGAVANPSFTLRSALLAVALCTALPATALAESPAYDGVPVTIIVSPKWKAETAERTPVTASVISGETIESRGVGDTLSLQHQVPGWSMKTNTVLGQPYLRGVGSDIISAGAESSVGMFVDGFYLPRALQSIQDFYDVANVEVLKGPQGVHLGRNVVGGAVSIITQEPLPFREASTSLQFGSYGERQMKLAINEPFLDGRAAVRFAGLLNDRDGYAQNIVVGDDQDDEHLRSWRAQYKYEPDSDLSLNLSVHDSAEDSSRYTGWSPDPNTPGSGALAAGGMISGDPRVLTHNFVAVQDVRKRLYGVRLNRILDHLAFTSATSIQRTDGNLLLDIDGTDLDFARNAPSETSRVFTQEFRLRPAVEDGPFDWLAGVYLLHETANQKIDVSLPLVAARNRTDGTVETDSWAVFGEVSYAPDDRWKATAGLRYGTDYRELQFTGVLDDPMGALGPPGTVVSTQHQKDHWTSVTPELSLSYQVDAHTLAWAKISEGEKAGGYNTSAAQPAFAPEKLLATEIGLKKHFPSVNLYTELAAFNYDYRDMQLLTPPAGSPLGTYPIVINAARSTIRGVDLSTRYHPITPIGLNLGATWLDAHYDDFVSQDPNRPGSNPNHAGQRLAQSPEVSLNAGLDYTTWFENGAQLKAAIGARYQSDIYYNIYQDPAGRQTSYTLFNASVTLRDPRGKWMIEVFGNNLGDKDYWQDIFRQDPLIGTARTPGAPRTLGVRAEVRY